MSKPANRVLNAIAAFLSALFLANCQDGGSELPNELHGKVVTVNSLPAAEVEVGLYSVDYIPADSGGSRLAWTTRTDASGKYAFRNIPSGRYNLVGSRDSLGFFRDSVSVAGAADIGRDSLGLLGRLSGTVRLQPQDDPRNVVIQVMGTDNYVNVGADGAFTLSGLAGGTYRLRVFVSLPNYVPLYRDIQVRAGRHDTLQPPLEPFYSGIPVVTGIKATYDTASGVARISWRPVAYPSLLTYLVYRDRADAVDLSGIPLNNSRLTDTVFYDTLYRRQIHPRVLNDTSGGWDDTASYSWEYRVRVKAANNTIGEPYEAAALRTISPANLSTTVRIKRLDGDADAIMKGDTVYFQAEYANAMVDNRSLAWIHGADTLRKIALAGKRGADTLKWVAPSALGSDSLQVAVVDAEGKHSSRKLGIRIVASRIIGTILSPYQPMEAFAWQGAIVHVAQDSLRRLSIGRFDLATRKDTLLSTAGKPDTLASTLSGSKLYLFNVLHPDFPGANVLTFDLATGAWGRETNLPNNALANSAAALNGKVYALSRFGIENDSVRISELDPGTHAWTAKKSLGAALMGHYFRLGEANGRLYAIQSFNGPYNTSYFAFDTATDEWSELPISDRFKMIFRPRLAGLKGTLYALTGASFSSNQYYNPWVERFDPAQSAWVPAPNFLIGRGEPGVVPIGSSLYIVSGSTFNCLTATVEEYRPE